MLFYTLDTSYKLCPEVFENGCFKALGDDPHKAVVDCLNNAVSLGWDRLYDRHIADYCELIDRVKLDLGGTDDGRNTEDLLTSYQNGNAEPYLEELYYAFGRHLLVSSSRKGTPPASLQGVWTVHDKSPWSCGFWHNINVQMNYWPAFNTNLAETFEAYADYWKNYVKQASVSASNWIRKSNPENYVDGDGECGWIIGTGAWMYQVEGMSVNTHSGPGTGGMTSKMFWDYYDFTRDKNILKEYSYPAIHGMSKFLTKSVRDYDGRYLCSFSASPEQILSGDWVTAHKHQQYYHTVGCAFDQQFIYENAIDDIIQSCKIKSESGGALKLRYEGFDKVSVICDGNVVETERDGFFVSFETQMGKTYIVSGFKPLQKREIATEFVSCWQENGVGLKWQGNAAEYAIYRAEGNDRDYTLVAVTKSPEFVDSTYNNKNKARLTYKVVCADAAYDAAVDGALTTLHPASKLEEERYKLLFNTINKNKR